MTITRHVGLACSSRSSPPLLLVPFDRSLRSSPVLHSDPSFGALTPRILHLLPPLPPPSPLRSLARFLRPAPHLIVGSSPPALLESFAPRIAPQILRSLPSLLVSVALRTLRSLPSIFASFATRLIRSEDQRNLTCHSRT